MRAPLLAFLVTFAGCTFVGLHSIWRFVVREQLPSLVHAGMAAGTTYAAWLIFLGTLAENPMEPWPKGPAVGLACWAAGAAISIHFYELRARVPYDGLFPWWKERR